MYAGDGDDIVAGAASSWGEAGNDRLAGASLDGGDGDDVLEATPFGSTLTGGPGADRLVGGAGSDQLSPGDGADVVDGGPGDDMLSYDRAVRVDLAAGTGDDDTLAGIEQVYGSPGDDVLLGDGGANGLDGGGGDDRIDGRGGDDALLGGDGDDLLRGGPGDDRLSDGGRDHGGPGDDFLWPTGTNAVACGAGTDTVFEPRRARYRRDCEVLEARGARVRIERTATTYRLRLSWNSREYLRPCRVKVNHVVLRRLPGTVVLPRAAKQVTLHPSSRCSGRIGTAYAVARFRLTS